MYEYVGKCTPCRGVQMAMFSYTNYPPEGSFAVIQVYIPVEREDTEK